jgi:hypothetical protein
MKGWTYGERRMPTARAADRVLFGMLYTALGLLTLWMGFRMADQVLEMRFVNDFLPKWETGVAAFEANFGRWPRFDGDNHAGYMQELTRRMRRSGVQPPVSNTGEAYRYRIERLAGEQEDVFILCLNDRIILFGVSEKTLGRLDKAVDNCSDLGSGRLLGRIGKNKKSYIGQWRL